MIGKIRKQYKKKGLWCPQCLDCYNSSPEERQKYHIFTQFNTSWISVTIFIEKIINKRYDVINKEKSWNFKAQEGDDKKIEG